MSLDRSTTQEQIALVIIIPIPPQILNSPQAGLSICNRSVHVMLLAILIDREPFEVDVPPWSELRFYRTGYVDWRFHGELFHAVFHDAELYGDDAWHLDSATEGYFAVTLYT